MEDRKVVAWGEGHSSWVSRVAFDSYWTSPNSNDSGETIMYRFGSVGQSHLGNKRTTILRKKAGGVFRTDSLVLSFLTRWLPIPLEL